MKGSHTESIREDLRKPENSLIISEESSRIIHELGNIKLYELGRTSRTIQCHSCFKYMPEGLAFCPRINRPRDKKCGESQRQQDHWKAVDAIRGTTKRGHDTTTIRWRKNEKYRNSQLAHGWTEEYCRYLDYLTTIDISHVATWEQRHRYESTITVARTTQDRQDGPMNTRKDFKPTTQVLASLRQEQGRQNSPTPKNARTRQRPFDEELQAKLECKTLNGVHTKTPNGEITHGKITNGKIMIGVAFQFAAANCCATPTNKITNGKIENGEPAVFFRSVSRTDIRECRVRDGV